MLLTLIFPSQKNDHDFLRPLPDSFSTHQNTKCKKLLINFTTCKMQKNLLFNIINNGSYVNDPVIGPSLHYNCMKTSIQMGALVNGQSGQSVVKNVAMGVIQDNANVQTS